VVAYVERENVFFICVTDSEIGLCICVIDMCVFYIESDEC